MIKIDKKYQNEQTEKFEQLNEKHDLLKLISHITGLSWKSTEFTITDVVDQEENTDVKKVHVGLSANALSIYSSVSFGLALEMLDQNGWKQEPEICSYLKEHPEAEKSIRRAVAFGVLYKIEKVISSSTEESGIMSKWNQWETVLDSSCGEIGKFIFEAWQNKVDNKDILTWLEETFAYLNKKEAEKKYLMQHRADGFKDNEEMNASLKEFYDKWFNK